MNGPGTFAIGGEIAVRRLGFGAMRIVGPGVFGPPADEDAMLRLLRRLPELGIDLVDTADSYGPDHSERLIRRALHPYRGMAVATKAGLVRTAPGVWHMDGRPEHLIARAKNSLRNLGVDRIDLWYLHRIDPTVPRDEQFGAVRKLLDEGVVRHVGLSEVGIAEVEAARGHFPVAVVQNRYNIADRASEDVLAWCEREGVGFAPWYPLGAGDLSRLSAALGEVAARYDASVNQIALAWLLAKSPVMLPIPGTARMAHLEENVRAGAIRLEPGDLARLEAAR